MNANSHSIAPILPQSNTIKRTQQKRAQILETAMRYFAEKGYEAARISDIASELGIAKGSIFQHFGSKDGLFLEAYKAAVASFPTYLDAPEEARQKGFFEVIRYWLTNSEHLLRSNPVAYRVVWLGNYGADLNMKKEINRFLLETDPLGKAELVKEAIRRGEIRTDVEPDLVVSILDWTFERFQDALLMEELDPGLFRRSGQPASRPREERIEEFLKVLQSALSARGSA